MKLTLNQKIVYTCLTALIIAGGMLVWLMQHTSQQFHHEANQNLHQDLAQYIVDHHKPLVTTDGMNQKALKSLFTSLMHIGPAYELYVLDQTGKVLTYSADPGVVKRAYVDLAPIEQKLQHPDSSQIVFGDDPRTFEKQKVFSVAPIVDGDIKTGYLYVILGGQLYESVADMAKNSQIFKVSLISALIILAIAIFTAALLSRRITRPIRELAASMRAFSEHDFATVPPMSEIHAGEDEIQQLASIYIAMAGRIHEQLETLKLTDHARRQIVAQVSHDLRTPLANVKGYLETISIKDDSLNAAERREYIDTAMRHCLVLEKLIAELFELARLDSGDTQLQLERFSINELASDVVQKFQLPAKKKSISVECDFDASNTLVTGDIARLERVLTNLVDNSLRYTPAGGTVQLLVDKLDTNDNNVRVAVIDNGPGIAQQDIPFVFDPYYRSKQHADVYQEGSGLGLAITKKIVELHNSSISVQSESGKGAMFSFHLQAV